LIPLPAFQKIMQDFDIAFVNNDQIEMKDQGYIKADKQMNDFVEYKDILRAVTPKKQISPETLTQMVVMMQSWWRMILA
jgi:hypothetical protein